MPIQTSASCPYTRLTFLLPRRPNRSAYLDCLEFNRFPQSRATARKWSAFFSTAKLIASPCHSIASRSAARRRAHGRMRFVRSASALCGAPGEESRTAPSERNAKNMNTTENLAQTESASVPVQPVNEPAKPLKFPNQPQEWKIVSLRECPTPLDLQLCETPEQAAAYWRTHVRQHPYFNSDCECLVVLILNTRRRIKGHYLVSIGTLDTILCHTREVFRLAIMAADDSENTPGHS